MTADSYTNFPNGITSMGVPLPNITQGNVWFVEPSTGVDSSGPNDGKTVATAFKTLAYALSRATANQNDIIYMFAQSNTAASTTDYQAATLTWNKDFVHLLFLLMVVVSKTSKFSKALLQVLLLHQLPLQ